MTTDYIFNRKTKKVLCLLLAIIFAFSSLAASKPAKTYQKAEKAMAKGQYEKAAELFETISSYDDASQQAMYCRALMYGEKGQYDEALKALVFLGDFKDSTYLITYYTICKLAFSKNASINDILNAADKFDDISIFRDSAKKAEECRQLAYKTAQDYCKQGKYNIAAQIFSHLGDYSDSKEQMNNCRIAIKDEQYNQAVSLMQVGDYNAAIAAFEKLAGYKDSADQIIACQMELKEIDYQKAVSFYQSENYLEAYSVFSTLTGYKDVDTILNTDENMIKAAYLITFEVGQTVLFGTYEQDNNNGNGKEDIEWVVLERKENSALLISKAALDCQPYNTSCTDTTWEKSSIRAWLNNTFLNESFSPKEQNRIVSVKVKVEKHPEFDTDPGNDTTDKVFLLSIQEAEKYFRYPAARRCNPTSYGKAKGCNVNKDGATAWWLRTPGSTQRNATILTAVGNDASRDVDKEMPIRPAIWISLDQ